MICMMALPLSVVPTHENNSWPIIPAGKSTLPLMSLNFLHLKSQFLLYGFWSVSGRSSKTAKCNCQSKAENKESASAVRK